MKESGHGDAAERREQSEVIEEFVSRREWERALREIDRLQQENQRLRQELEVAWRAAKRQAAPLSRGEPQRNPPRPGRKCGARYGEHRRRAVPEQVDEDYRASLPEQCGCGGRKGPN